MGNGNTKVTKVTKVKYGLYLGGYDQSSNANHSVQYVGRMNKENKIQSITDGLMRTNTNNGNNERSLIQTITLFNDEIYVGGFDGGPNEVDRRQYVAKFNTETQSFENKIGGLVTDYASQLYDMIVYNKSLYVCGTQVTDSSGNHVSQYLGKTNSDGTSFSQIYSGIRYNSTASAQLNTMAVYKDRLYVGGSWNLNTDGDIPFFNSSGTDNVFDPNSTTTFLNGSGSTRGYIYVMRVYKDELYIGGSSGDGNSGISTQKPFVAKLNSDGTTFTFMDNLHDSIGMIRAMAVYKDELYVGGSYNDVATTYTQQYVAKLNSDGTSFGDPIVGLDTGEIDKSLILGMDVYKDVLYVCGFDHAKGSNKIRGSLAKLNSDGTSFEQITDQLPLIGQSRLLAMKAFDTADGTGADGADGTDSDGSNLALILGLALGIGIPVLGLAIYYLVLYFI